MELLQQCGFWRKQGIYNGGHIEAGYRLFGVDYQDISSNQAHYDLLIGLYRTKLVMAASWSTSILLCIMMPWLVQNWID